MTEFRGKCKNTEYCSNATTQRVISLPENAPPECPKCGEPLEALQAAKRGQRNRALLALQVVVIIAGAGGVAYKLLTGASSSAPQTASTNPAPAPQETPSTIAAADTPAPVQAATAAPPQAAPAATILLKLAGSGLIGDKLARRLAAGYLGLIGDTDITLASVPDGVAVIGNQAGQHEGIAIAAGTSASGLQALLRGSADIAMSLRPPTQAELDKLGTIGDLTSPANEHVVAVEAIAAIVAAANRMPSLTTAQLHGIFTGQITDWRQLGGAPGPIRPVLQNAGAGADTAADFVLAGAPPAQAAKRAESEDRVAASVAADPGAIGLVALGHAGTARVLPVGGGGEPVTPTDITISTEDYPLTRRLYFYNGATTNNFIRRFTDYVASPAGQAAVEAAGFVPLTLKAAPVAVPDAASERFRRAVAGATRVSVDFRFQPGSVELDSRAVHDIDRLVAFLRAQHAEGTRLILAGFADSSGDAAANQSVAQLRANALASALARYNIHPGRVEAFGADLPVADNATPEGRERNRRVEVYLSPST